MQPFSVDLNGSPNHGIKNSNLEINCTYFFLIFTALLFFLGIRIGALLGDLEMEMYSDGFDLKVIPMIELEKVLKLSILGKEIGIQLT